MYKSEECYVDYTVSIVNNQKIRYDSFNSLSPKTWVENESIDICFFLEKNRYPDCQIEQLFNASILFLSKHSDEHIKTL